ncbi:MAG TPA: ATP-binding protein [Nitrospiraceae bacterium]
MRWPLQFLNDLPIARKLFLASVIPVLTVVVLSILTYRSVVTFSEDEGELNNIYVAQRLAAEYLRLVVDLETGFRGFIMTKQEKYLYPYRTAQDHIRNVGSSLEEKVHSQQEQRDLVAKVQELVKQFAEEKEVLIEDVKAGNQEKARIYIEESRGRQIMRKIRESMARLDQLEHDVLNARLAKLYQDRNAMLTVILGGGLFALVLMVFALHLIGRSITGPLAALAKAVRTSPSGLVPTVPVMDRKDEIGNLTNMMHAMSAQIRDHLAAVEKSETELRALNQDLSASESKYRSLVDHAPFGIFTTKGMAMVFSNRYNRVLAGLNPDEEGDPEAIRSAIHPEDRDRVLSEFEKAVKEGRPYETVFRFLHKDGMVRKVLSRRIPIKDTGGQVVMYQGFNIDITALDQMQTRLSRSERLATLGQVAAGIAHEIRNPLVGIGSTTSLLVDDTDVKDPRRSDLEVILRETRRLDRIVNQIIEYARPRELAPVLFSFADLVQEVLKLLDAPLSTKALKVTCAIPPSLPQVHADRDQMKQVLLNVFQNAIEASGDGSGLSVAAGPFARNLDPGIVITVTDQGPGISSEDLPHVFEPFFTRGKHRGTGLGLAICRNIVDAHGGDIQLTSGRGKGTTARLWLPLRQQPRLIEV